MRRAGRVYKPTGINSPKTNFAFQNGNKKAKTHYAGTLNKNYKGCFKIINTIINSLVIDNFVVEIVFCFDG